LVGKTRGKILGGEASGGVTGTMNMKQTGYKAVWGRLSGAEQHGEKKRRGGRGKNVSNHSGGGAGRIGGGLPKGRNKPDPSNTMVRSRGKRDLCSAWAKAGKIMGKPRRRIRQRGSAVEGAELWGLSKAIGGLKYREMPVTSRQRSQRRSSGWLG